MCDDCRKYSQTMSLASRKVAGLRGIGELLLLAGDTIEENRADITATLLTDLGWAIETAASDVLEMLGYDSRNS